MIKFVFSIGDKGTTKSNVLREPKMSRSEKPNVQKSKKNRSTSSVRALKSQCPLIREKP
jgi:hypothetical protein